MKRLYAQPLQDSYIPRAMHPSRPDPRRGDLAQMLDKVRGTALNEPLLKRFEA